MFTDWVIAFCLNENSIKKTPLSVQTFAKCFFKKIGILDEAGNFVSNVATEQLTAFVGDKGKAEEVIKDCQAPDATEKDAVPLAIYKCFAQHKLLKQE